jgi:glycosyltransferase involved in cell wall biosynthesis
MKVSVVVPVYNAAPYVRAAVESVLQQPETGEVILVEDGSRDNSLEVCRALAEANPIVRLITHTGKQNRGASVSRNAGIDAATLPYLAFLDADDFYLPNRFTRARQLFSENPDADAVFESIGTHFENDQARRQYEAIGGPLITGMQHGLPPDKVFESMGPIGSSGHCSLVGLTLRRDSVPEGLRFDTGLPIGEDTAFFLKLAATLNVAIGDRNHIVAKRRVHASNHITRQRSPKEAWNLQQHLWLSVYRWLARDPSQHRHRQILVSKMIWKAAHSCFPEDAGFLPRRFGYLGRLARLIVAQPQLLCENRFLKTVVKQAR